MKPNSLSSDSSVDTATLDTALAVLAEHAGSFARLPAREKQSLLLTCCERVVEVAPEWVAAGLAAKKMPPDLAGEEWLGGPMTAVRLMRLLANSLGHIADSGRPALGLGHRRRADGRWEVEVFPASAIDSLTFAGFTARTLLQPGVDEQKAHELCGEFYQRKDPEGGVALILGAGNVSSIPAMDVASKMFIEGYVCILKMNPVNAWVGPFLERALLPLIERNFLRVVYGGGDVGQYLVDHNLVDDVHMTGSNHTHDMIVWGPPGPDRDARMAQNKPRLTKPISSELGNITPVVVVPGDYSTNELEFAARNVATMLGNNVSFNCIAGKMLVLAEGWPQKARFIERLKLHVSRLPPRFAYYPGAADRYDKLTQGRPNVSKFGQRTAENLPWTIVEQVNSGDPKDSAFSVEPFCPILFTTELPGKTAEEFLPRAKPFLDDVLWGTLAATILVAKSSQRDASFSAAFESFVTDLRYGTICINHFAGVGYGLGTTPWGGHPSATLTNVQSGLGWVHNSYMLGGVEKTIVTGPSYMRMTPVWFYDQPKTPKMGRTLVELQAKPRWRKLAALTLKMV